ncbi:2-dehydropantoate 2-reductase [Alphaproteobacteria bacterium]|nr:2-dehydropantoate 2-reductase [Alphaproteobacteria bacterium]
MAKSSSKNINVPRIAIVGAGAMGSVYAGLFAEAGYQISVVDLWQEHITAIGKTGLHLEGASGDRVIGGITAVHQIADLGSIDLYVIATKANGVGDAAAEIAKVMQPDSLVLTIQNGLGAGDRIAQYMPTDNVLLGVAEGFGASIKGPGHIHHNAMRQIRIGEMGGGMTDRLVWIESLWQAAGFKATAFADIHQLVWEKFICNVMCSAPSVAFDCTIGELFSDEDRRIVALGCMLEAYEIGLTKNIAFSFDDAVAYGVKFAADMPHASPSMRLDHLAGKRSEIDAINGMVPVLGREMGIKTPYNDTLVALVRAREASFA